VLAKNRFNYSGHSHKRVLKAFEKCGWKLKEGGSHAILLKEGYAPLTIPRHNPVNKHILKSQIKQAGIDVNEFFKEL